MIGRSGRDERRPILVLDGAQDGKSQKRIVEPIAKEPGKPVGSIFGMNLPQYFNDLESNERVGFRAERVEQDWGIGKVRVMHSEHS